MPNGASNRSPSPSDAAQGGGIEELASQLAGSHVIFRRPRVVPSLLDRLQERESLLRDAYEYLGQLPKVQRDLSYTAEWLLDNFYVVQQAVRQVQEDMPPGYYRQLPKLGTSPLAGYPRVYALAQAIIEYSEAHLDLDRVTRFVQAYQQVTPLTMGELWALPTMLRLGCLECLARAVARVAGMQERDIDDPVACLSLPHDLADDAIVANCILSLRVLGTQDWKAFFEDVSRVEQVLHRDPAGVYAKMDFETRDRYRGVIEELAQATGRDEEDVAREAVRLAQSGGDSPRTNHAGFYLVDTGRAQLENCLGYRPSWGIRLRRWLLDHPTLVYLGGVTLLTLLVVLSLAGYGWAAGGTTGQLIGVVLLTLLPAVTVAVNLVNWWVTHSVPPRTLPKMDFLDGVPAEYSTMVVVPALLTNEGQVRSLLRQLEPHFLGNKDPHIHFALLTDFTDAPEKHVPGDDVLLEQVKIGVQALNRKYGQRGSGPFYIFHREREWNPGEDCWMGWERKRGKLVEFNRLLAGEETSCVEQIGDPDALSEIRYVITLDADTVLPRDAAHRLIATLAHPLNRAEFDPDDNAVVAGYTVLQPRVEIIPTSANRSLFTRIFSGDTGLDIYTRAISDVYQDLFGEGIYAGKGIYDVAAFERSLAGRAPDNTLLSHDLFEGIHGRAGLVTDVLLYEDFPSHYLAHVRRLHRWVRGDWQLLPWLGFRAPRADGGKMPNDRSVIDRWKMLDNLRRSLLTPALLTLFVAGWLWLPGRAAAWTLAGLLVLAVPVYASVFATLTQGLRRASPARAVHSVWTAALRWLLALIFIPHETLTMIDAILATLVRLFITRKRLLQWTTDAHTIRLSSKETKLGLLWQEMGAASLLTLAFACLVILINPEALPSAAPLLILWMISPFVVYWISRPIAHKRVPLSAAQRQQLRRLARRTWLYFERFVGPDDHWLPPDHFQEDPRGLVAHRTSPTNLGLLLLSTLAAYDLGYIGPLDLSLLLRPTLESMGELERYRGHFLNWYDTRNMQPLPPRYVSVVDSGNLAGCLLVLKQGLQALPSAPVLLWQRQQGLLDTLEVLAEIVQGVEEASLETVVTALQDYLAHVRQQVLAVRDNPGGWAPLLATLSDEVCPELERLLISLIESPSHPLDVATLGDLRVWSERVCSQLLGMQGELDMLLPWLMFLSRPPMLFTWPGANSAITDAWHALVDSLPTTPTIEEVTEVCKSGQVRLAQLQGLLADGDGMGSADQACPELDEGEWVEEARAWCADLSEGLALARMTAQTLLVSYRDLSEQADAFFRAMDFGFLFNPHRQVFHIGYDVETRALDINHIDPLACEARIASLLAIATDQVPQSHWLHLARPITRVNGTRVLLSWGGTMLEYLMPFLLIRSYEDTLLERSGHAAVNCQITYARRKGVPWGISESACYHLDADKKYRYRTFGVPALGFRRGLAEDLVVSPYASLLALPLYPHAVMQNIAHLIESQMLGRYGFYEAIDYTDSRLPPGRSSAIVRSYMVHHQSMILLSLTNYLQDEVMVRRFHADPRVQSIQLLLHEQIPHEAPVEYPHLEKVRVVHQAHPLAPVTPRRIRARTPTP